MLKRCLYMGAAAGLCLLAGCGSDTSAIDVLDFSTIVRLSLTGNALALLLCLLPSGRIWRFVGWFAGDVFGFLLVTILGMIAFPNGFQVFSYLIIGFFWGAMTGGMLGAGVAGLLLSPSNRRIAVLLAGYAGLAFSVPARLFFPPGLYEDAGGQSFAVLTLAMLCAGAGLLPATSLAGRWPAGRALPARAPSAGSIRAPLSGPSRPRTTGQPPGASSTATAACWRRAAVTAARGWW